MPADVDHYSVGAQLRAWPPLAVQAPIVCFAVGYQTVTLATGPITEIDYFGVPTGNTFTVKDRSKTIYAALGFHKQISLSVGLSAKRIREDLGSLETDSWAFDAGFFAQYPLLLRPADPGSNRYFQLTPAFGVSVTNAGNDVHLLLNSYPLPRSLRYGVSCPLAYGHTMPFGPWNLVSLTPAFEREDPCYDDNVTKFGLETGLGEALYFRTGKVDTGWDNDKTTWGFTVDLRGLAKSWAALRDTPTATRSPLGFLIHSVHLRYAESHSDIDGMGDWSTYRGVLIGLAF